MNDRNNPDDVVLSSHELHALQRMEADLSGDRRLARRMSRPAPRGRLLLLSLTVAVLTCASVVLVVLGIRTSEPTVIWGFAVVWPFTLLQAFRLLCRVSRIGDRVSSWL